MGMTVGAFTVIRHETWTQGRGGESLLVAVQLSWKGILGEHNC